MQIADENRGVAIFPAIRGNSPILFCILARLIGIKRRAALIKAHEAHLVTPLPAGLSSLFYRNLQRCFGTCCGMSNFGLSLAAYRGSVMISDNEPTFSIRLVASFRRASLSRNLHLFMQNQPMFYRLGASGFRGRQAI